MARLLSAHSSNPLESQSRSSPRKRRRNDLKAYAKTTRRDSDAAMESSDPISGYGRPELEFQKSIKEMYPDMKYIGEQGTPKPRKQLQRMTRSMKKQQVEEAPAVEDAEIDADDGVGSDEELTVRKGQLDDFPMGGDDDGDIVEDDADRDSLEIVDAYDGEGPDSEEAVEEDHDDDANSDEEEMRTIEHKAEDEQHEIMEEIDDLERVVPVLKADFKLLDRLGSGTFSSVYKAVDLWYHTKWYNGAWHGIHSSKSSAYYQSHPIAPDRTAFVAIKRIYVTSNPERIRNEIAILEDCRSCRHVSQLITAFREKDQVVVIMPYHRNMEFKDFYQILPMASIKSYFRCMFRALRDIHARMVIHRDVKPANFLFDPRTGLGTLCDFGLASRIEPASSMWGQCLHEPASPAYPHGRVKRHLDANHIKAMQRDARTKSNLPSDRVGYPEKDLRPHSRANRAGTRGFRAPEVLLKCNDQTGGIMLLFFLSKKFPLFQSSDDIEATMEIATIIGKKSMEKAATLHSRTFMTNVPSIENDGISWRDFCLRQNPTLLSLPSHVNNPDPSQASWFGGDIPVTAEEHKKDAEDALDLVEMLLNPESVKRPEPKTILKHPFLRGRVPRPRTNEGEGDSVADGGEYEDDDAFFPHPFGEGKCGEWHFKDEVTEQRNIKLSTGEVRQVAAGEGTAIGNRPCVFHKDLFPDEEGGHDVILGGQEDGSDVEQRT